MSKTSIEWTQHTWNPMAGCSILSPGCINCYAMKRARRIEACNAGLRTGGVTHYAGTTRVVNGNAVWTGKIGFSESALLKPLKRKAPTTWFVNSMSDMFHEDAPDEAIDKVFAVMALTPQHTYQVLTKRSARMREYLTACGAVLGRQQEIRAAIVEIAGARDAPGVTEAWLRVSGAQGDWKPLPNVWLGVSTERQKEADERIPDLLTTPAAVRFISAEPLLGPIDLSKLRTVEDGEEDWLDGTTGEQFSVRTGCEVAQKPALHWVIVGGESGPDARPMHPDWARSLRDQCAGAGVPFFFKQWGSFVPIIDRDKDDPDWRSDYTRANHNPDKFKILNLAGGCGFHGERVHLLQRYSKAHAGRLLDGVTHDSMPEAAR